MIGDAVSALQRIVALNPAQDGAPPHHLEDVPLLLARASVAGLRQPARWLLWPTTALFCARCGGEVVSALLAKTNGTLSLAAGRLSWSGACKPINLSPSDQNT